MNLSTNFSTNFRFIKSHKNWFITFRVVTQADGQTKNVQHNRLFDTDAPERRKRKERIVKR